MSSVDLDDLALRAYIWGYPLLVMERTRFALTEIGPSMPAPRGAPMNALYHGDRLATPRHRAVVAPNVDTLYSSAWLDLAQGPQVLSAPDTAGRYYSVQFMDAYTNTFACVGRRTTGTDARTFVIAGPGWTGTPPAGATLLRAPTDAVWMLLRVLVASDENAAQVHELQKRFTLAPLGAATGAAPYGVRMAAAQKATGAMDLPKLAPFTVIGAGLALNPPPPDEAADVRAFLPLGIGGPKGFDAAGLGPSFQEALAQGAKAGEIAVRKLRSTTAPSPSGWLTPLDIGIYGRDYDLRAAIAQSGLGALVPAEAAYSRATKDSEGRHFDGARRYTLRFAKSELPPCESFWSLTLYGPDHFLVENEIKRYAIGDRTPGLAWNANGSLDIHIQNRRPENGPSNWLPAPEGPFYLTLRAYLPKQIVLDGQYAPPAVRAVG